MSGTTQDEDKKPDQGGAHINLKVKGQVHLSLSWILRARAKVVYCLRVCSSVLMCNNLFFPVMLDMCGSF